MFTEPFGSRHPWARKGKANGVEGISFGTSKTSPRKEKGGKVRGGVK